MVRKDDIIMDGMKLTFSIANLARKNGWGYGSYRLCDGSSVKLTSDAKTGITRLFHVKNNRLIAAEVANGNNEVTAMVDRYAQKAVYKDEADYAFMNSFDTFA